MKRGLLTLDQMRAVARSREVKWHTDLQVAAIQLRVQCGLDQDDFSKLLGIHSRTIYRIEGDAECKPRGRTWARYYKLALERNLEGAETFRRAALASPGLGILLTEELTGITES